MRGWGGADHSRLVVNAENDTSPTFLQKEMEKLRARYQRGSGG